MGSSSIRCRICVKKSKLFTSLYFKNEQYPEYSNEELLKECSSLKVKEEFSTIICFDCLKKLTISYEFKILCKNSNIIWNKNLEEKRKSQKNGIVTKQINKKIIKRKSKKFVGNLRKKETTRKSKEKDANLEKSEEQSINNKVEIKIEDVFVDGQEYFTNEKNNVNKDNNENKDNLMMLFDNEKSDDNFDLILIDKINTDGNSLDINDIKEEWQKFTDDLNNPLDNSNAEKSSDRLNDENSKVAKSTKSKKLNIYNVYRRIRVCFNCDEKFDATKDYEKHIFDVHSSNPVCHYCTIKFTTIRQLQYHVYNAHKQELRKRQHEERVKRLIEQKKSNLCPHCGRQFTLLSNLKQHIGLHLNNKPFNCQQCTKRFQFRNQLRRHILISHSDQKNYACDICGKAFALEKSFLRHQETHSTVRNYVCRVCGRSYKTMSSLRTHSILHSDVKRFVCKFCDKAFTIEKYLRVHIRVHTGEKPHKCNLCDKTFAQWTSLNYHVAHYHNVIKSK